MNHIERSLTVRCPASAGRKHLENWFSVHATAGGETARVALHVTAAIAELEKPMSLNRSAVATFQRPSATFERDGTSLKWEPQSPGPFPLFTGRMFLERNGTRGTLQLRIAGTSTPPLAFIGLRDDVIGNRLAVATADELLARVREFIERDRDIERIKASLRLSAADPRNTRQTTGAQP